MLGVGQGGPNGQCFLLQKRLCGQPLLRVQGEFVKLFDFRADQIFRANFGEQTNIYEVGANSKHFILE